MHAFVAHAMHLTKAAGICAPPRAPPPPRRQGAVEGGGRGAAVAGCQGWVGESEQLDRCCKRPALQKQAEILSTSYRFNLQSPLTLIRPPYLFFFILLL